jgi:hypothetical protein
VIADVEATESVTHDAVRGSDLSVALRPRVPLEMVAMFVVTLAPIESMCAVPSGAKDCPRKRLDSGRSLHLRPHAEWHGRAAVGPR